MCLSVKLKNLILNQNFFKDPEKKTEWHLCNQYYSTRIFIVCLVTTLAILILFTSISDVTKTVIIKEPTIDIYSKLQAQYSEALVCPCSSISIEYKQFISFQPTFHQICASDFITDKWTDYFFTVDYVCYKDFRSIGSTFFTTLAAFCKLSIETIDNALVLLNSEKYVTRNVRQLDLFQSETEQITDNFKRSTVDTFLQQISLATQTLTINALFSGYLFNYGFTIVNDNSSDLLTQVFFPYKWTSEENDTNTTCSCKTTPFTCHESTGIYEDTNFYCIPLYIIPGIRVSCSFTATIFQSTLECFFDQDCLDAINNLIYAASENSLNATILIYNSTNTQYNTTTPIQDIIENLMIEQWNNQTSFTSYFQQCNPQSCTYTYKKKGDFGYIFTTLVGLIGGLTAILRILIPPIISFARRKKKPVVPIINGKSNKSMNMRNIISNSFTLEVSQVSHTFLRRINISLVSFIYTLNLFKNSNKRSDNQLRHQRISTRLFILLLSFSLIVMILINSLDNVTYNRTIQNPTVDQFNTLIQQYFTSVKCPCTTLSIQYQNFISFQPTLHTLCSSDFINITSPWLSIDYPSSMFTRGGEPRFRANIDDFRHIASPFFQFINASCQLSLQTISTELNTFNSTTFISPNLITLEQFQSQTNLVVLDFVENTARSFISALLFINNMTRVNMLISAMSTDSVLTRFPQYDYISAYNYVYEYIYDMKDQLYNSTSDGIECDCQQSSWCKQQAIIYDIDATTPLFIMPGQYQSFYTTSIYS